MNKFYVLIDRPEYDVLPLDGTRSGKYHVRDAIIEPLAGSSLVRIKGTHEIFDYFYPGQLIPPPDNRPYHIMNKDLSWYDPRRWFGKKFIMWKEYKHGWHIISRVPFDMVVHNSRISALSLGE